MLLVILGLGLFQVGLVGFFLARLNLWERLGTAASGLALLAVAAVGAGWLLIPAGALAAFILLGNYRKRRSGPQRTSSAEVARPAQAASRQT